MTDKPVDLDQHRGMAAQKATELCRLLAEVAANEQALRETQDQLEAQLIAAPASTWEEAADMATSRCVVCGGQMVAGRMELDPDNPASELRTYVCGDCDHTLTYRLDAGDS